VGVAETGVDIGRHARRLEVPDGGLVAALVDLNGDEPAPGLAQGQGDPDRRVSRRGADLERSREALGDDQIVEHLPVLVGDVLVAPFPPGLLQEPPDPGIQGRVARLGGGGRGCRREPKTDPENIPQPTHRAPPPFHPLDPEYDAFGVRYLAVIPARDQGHVAKGETP
jgi:hypothetical protein